MSALTGNAKPSSKGSKAVINLFLVIISYHTIEEAMENLLISKQAFHGLFRFFDDRGQVLPPDIYTLLISRQKEWPASSGDKASRPS